MFELFLKCVYACCWKSFFTTALKVYSIFRAINMWALLIQKKVKKKTPRFDERMKKRRNLVWIDDNDFFVFLIGLLTTRIHMFFWSDFVLNNLFQHWLKCFSFFEINIHWIWHWIGSILFKWLNYYIFPIVRVALYMITLIHVLISYTSKMIHLYCTGKPENTIGIESLCVVRIGIIWNVQLSNSHLLKTTRLRTRYWRIATTYKIIVLILIYETCNTILVAT